MKSVLKYNLIILFSLAVVCAFPRPAVSAKEKLVSSLAIEFKDGAIADIIKAVAKKLDARLEIKYAPFKRRLKMMEDGDIDFLAGILKNPAREKYIYYIKPPYKNRSDTVFFVQRGKTDLIQRYEDLYAITIGTLIGSKYFDKFDNDARLNKEVSSSAEFNVKKLMAGRIDAAAFPESAGIDLIDHMGLKERITVADYRFCKQKSVYIGISRKSRLMESIRRIEDIMQTMIDNGEIKTLIVDHYTSRGLPVPEL